jgi:hypothetical protein
MLCWRAAWDQIEPKAGGVLKAAAEYDQLADLGDTDNAYHAYKPLSESLSAVNTQNPTDLAKFWGWATRLIAFGQKIETAFSKENRDKIDKAIDAIVKNP